MAKIPCDAVLRYLRRVAAPRDGGECSDLELLHRFSAGRDEIAFESLVRRHLGMVWNVCRRVLRHSQDAEDACQATFVVLLRKAGALGGRGPLGNWLYTVAYRISLRADSARRRQRDFLGASAITECSDSAIT